MDILNFIILATEQAVEHAPEVVESGSVVGTLGLNAKLFIAQLINFSVILFILWRWVWKPLGGAMESRRKKIEESVAKAANIEKQAQEAQTTRELKLREAAVEAEAILQRNLDAGEKMKMEIVSTANNEAKKILAKAKQTIEAEKQHMLSEIKIEVADLVVMTTEKILRVKLDEKNDKKIVEEILKSVK
ncbi:MAG: ATP synthase F0 subunit B [Candidatus Doudnabacteria bacterium RIFCSPHIGHO2_01_FULL_46_14]|uniref:ATP synthase subunit b n=1 Tax=Candidatus Doudnabacteria bacterium RIFCSPHIGHO2_01_FULL_46_14 TaxID=1817824 RepID=A0A1F5NNR9_9BACT|nr:MAG: ATP synthase F0 subunit B [Candidatus Doudnabacteria bacterium RIFCSPHIGHO2_01_FULL_46_14]